MLSSIMVLLILRSLELGSTTSRWLRECKADKRKAFHFRVPLCAQKLADWGLQEVKEPDEVRR